MTRRILCLILVFLAGGVAFAQMPPEETSRRPKGAVGGILIVPDHFLRPWDPVTIFFEKAVGSPRSTPEDHPEKFLSFSPKHPGAFTWIDPQTLQFRPADPWPPLGESVWTIGSRRFVLRTLMARPARSIPSNGATDLGPIEELSLSFSQPIPPETLSRMLRIETRPLPGFGEKGLLSLGPEDYSIKTMAREKPGDPADYVLRLHAPIPFGRMVKLYLRLSTDDRDEDSVAVLSFSTAPPFTATAFHVGQRRLPIARAGSLYTPDEALVGGMDRRISIEFSSEPAASDPLSLRKLLRISPPVDDLKILVSGARIQLTGSFVWNQLYRLQLVGTELEDRRGRRLELDASSEVYVVFKEGEDFLSLPSGRGLMERFGPQMVPLKGRGQSRVDLRIYPIDPLDFRFWPFSDQPVSTSDELRPPGPGETPLEPIFPAGPSRSELASYIRTLGSPPVSEIIELPLNRKSGGAGFGCDLRPYLERISTAKAAGHYLLGFAPLDGKSPRKWMRVQVTDLSLGSIETRNGFRLEVSSLATAEPIPGALIRIEGRRMDEWQTLRSGKTGADGSCFFPRESCPRCSIERIVVNRNDDVLVIDPQRGPDVFRRGAWLEDRKPWLAGLFFPAAANRNQSLFCHLFTERPVYRPGEVVHLKGYLRSRREGKFSIPQLKTANLIIKGPGDLEWRRPVKLSSEASFDLDFQEKNIPTGSYTAHLEVETSGRVHSLKPVPFQVEAYRLPRFEINLHGPDRTPLDRPFEISLTARYYAGGRVADRPLSWRVTQFPYAWKAPEREGFVFSSDARFSGLGRFEAGPEITRRSKTDTSGAAKLSIDPTIESTAQPRSYVVEATITGADDQTVTATRKIVALPPFILGLKAPRYLEKGKALVPEVIILDAAGKVLEGMEFTLLLKSRQWHSYLQASDFSSGRARYLSDVVDREIFSKKLKSGSKSIPVELSLPGAGVYIVEIEARDAFGRAQKVAVDLYAGGKEKVAWSRPSEKILKIQPDRRNYDPGDTAQLVIESPFQRGRLLVVVEKPDGNAYEELRVEGGKAVFKLPIEENWTPAIDLHFILERGRLSDTHLLPGSLSDLGKPATMAASLTLPVNPLRHRIDVLLEAPEKALPGRTIDIRLKLRDAFGHPLAGEACLWLVDQAALALGREEALDPLPDFIQPRTSAFGFRNSRGYPFGEIPFAPLPGGGESSGEGGSILDRTTVRRNFKVVPFYEPRIQVGSDGETVLHVKLPDDLTNFKIRAKAVSGPGQFGFGTGSIAVRLPLIVQPALPRFVRPGDRFTASAISRIVEGPGGEGAAEIRVEGMKLLDAPMRKLLLKKNEPERLNFDVEISTPQADENKSPADEVRFSVGVLRNSDSARDAFDVRLPLRPDRRPEVRRQIIDLEKGKVASIPAIEEEIRPQSLERSALFSDQPALLRMAAGLSYLMDYPFGCTEQRISRASAFLQARRFDKLLDLRGDPALLDHMVEETLAWIPQVLEENGLAGYWPGSRGSVTLTALALRFMVEAREAGYQVDEKISNILIGALQRSLRSDSTWLIDGAAFSERSRALLALTRAGRFSQAYASELARNADYLDLESKAEILQSFELGGIREETSRRKLARDLSDGVIIRLWNGKESYGGLQDDQANQNALILPSETRTLAEITRALAHADPPNPDFHTLVDGLIRLGRDNGWGTTSANAAALAALSEVLTTPDPKAPRQLIRMKVGGRMREIELGGDKASRLIHFDWKGGLTLVQAEGEDRPVGVRVESRWVGRAPGAEVPAVSRGFVIIRESLRLDREKGAPPHRKELEKPGMELEYSVGDIVEEHLRLVNPEERYFVAILAPIAAGMEPLNPNLATASHEAAPSGKLSLKPTYVEYLDDRVAWYYTSLPRGNYDFYFRTRATVPGRFNQPPAESQLMYDDAVRGAGNGAWVLISAPDAGK